MAQRSTAVLVALAALMAAAIVFIGIRFLFMPESSAAGYGVAASADGDAAAYLSAKGLRDLTFGAVGLALLATRQLRAAGWLLAVSSIVAFGDALIVLAHGGPPMLAYSVHGGTGVAMVLLGSLLIRSQRPGKALASREPSPAGARAQP